MINGDNIDTNFNPRSREGSDMKKSVLMFPRRNFNPRSREGSDGSCDSCIR